MALKPEGSIFVGLATATIVYAIHSQATPTQADIRVGQPNDETINAQERTASWLGAGVVAGISLIAKDPTVFIIGGLTVIGMAWWTRYNNATNPVIGSLTHEGAHVTQITPTHADQDDDYSLASVG